MRDKNCEHGYWTAFPCDKCTIESLRTQLADAQKRAEGAERVMAESGDNYRTRIAAFEKLEADLIDALKGHYRGLIVEAVKELRADLTRVAQERDDLGLQLASKTFEAQDARDALARVTEDNNQLRDARAGSSAPLVRALNDLTAAQERIQALEAQVGMLRDALTAASKILPVGSICSGDDAGIQSTRNMVNKALSHTESQAAEVVRGMERVCEAVRRIDFPDGWSKVRDALAALEAVRGKG